jgi:RimJ/RimL family protein N-acetyltransferase
VEEGFRGRGIASRLLRQLIPIARANRIVRFEADVLAENAPMLGVLRNSGLRMEATQGQGVVHATLYLT